MSDIPHFTTPFRIIGKAAATIEQDSDEDLLLNVATLLRTEVESRDELPEYGVEDPAFQSDRYGEYTDLIREWEPRVAAESEAEIHDLIQTVKVSVTDA